MIFVTNRELEIQSIVFSPSDKSNVQVLFNVGLTIFLFPIVFNIVNNSEHLNIFINRPFTSSSLSFQRKQAHKMQLILEI